MKSKFNSMWRVAVALVLVLSLGLVMGAPVAAAVTQPEVTVVVAEQGVAATSYTIVFTTNEDLTTAAGDTITIEFPEGTTSDTNIDSVVASDVTVGGTAATAVSIAGTRLSITPAADVDAGEVTVVVNTNITNPAPMGDDYTLDVYTSQESTRVTSETYIIGTVVTIDSVATAPDTVDTASAYTITFTPDAALEADVDTITITFPDDTDVPSIIHETTVTVGSVCEEAPTVVGRTVTVTVPDAVSGQVAVLFAVGAGIKNPTTIDNPNYLDGDETDDWRLTMYTSQDIVPVESPVYTDPFVAKTETAITKLVVKDVDTYVLNDTMSTAMTIEAQDEYGNPTVVGGSGITVDLSADPSDCLFWDEPETGVITSVTIANTASESAHFHFQSAVAGTYTITAAESPEAIPNWTDGTAEVTVSPKVELWGAGTKIGDYISIQDAIDAAVPYDTIKVPAGLYEENIGVTKANLTIESISGKASTTIEGTVTISADNSALGGSSGHGFTLQEATGTQYLVNLSGGPENATISYNTLIQSKEGTHAIKAASSTTGLTVTQNAFTLPIKWGMGVFFSSESDAIELTVTYNDFTGGGSTVDNSAIELHNVDISTLDTVISHNTFTDLQNGILIGTDQVGTGLTSGTDAETVGTLEISNNTFDGLMYAIDLVDAADVTQIQNVVITRNTFTSNTIGLGINKGACPEDPDKWQPADFTVQYNDFSGNTYAVFNNTNSTDVTETLDVELVATNNYWGAATGPGDDAIGTGNTGIVSSSTPWLSKSESENVIASFPALSVDLSTGWNTLSAPAKLISTADAIDELVTSGVSIAYSYDGAWVPVTTGYVLNPCDAVYIKMSSAQTVLFQVDGAITWVPSEDLAAGWNLIGLARLMPLQVDEAVASVGGSYAQVVSPSMNAHDWVYVSGQDPAPDPMPAFELGEGYWIFMKSEATLGGFTLCPIVPQY